jgi:peptidoglycan/LPS O-acetylase OafA/YrhL
MKRLELLDYARFAAALAVVAFHYLFNGIADGKLSSLRHIPDLVDIAKYGYLGVDFFFIISGYVIFNTARNKTAGEFATSRAVRLYPSFWAAMLLTAYFATALGAPELSVTPLQVLANFTMVPGLFGRKPVDGVYWTLGLELRFYAMVLIVLFLGFGRALERIFLIWPLIMLAALAANIDHFPYLGGYFPYFAAGALFAMLREQVDVKTLGALAVCLFLSVVGSAHRGAVIAQTTGTPFSTTIISGIVVALFAFFFVLNTRRGLNIRLRGSRLAGGLTYPIYLVHAHIGYILLSRYATEENKAFAYPAVLSLVLLVACFIHLTVERGLAATWHAGFERVVGRPIDSLQSTAAQLLGVRRNPPPVGEVRSSQER